MSWILVTLLALGSACARVPEVTPVPPPTTDEKLSWILRLEDQRLLRDPQPPAVGVPEEGAQPDPPPPARPQPDLVALLGDPEAQLRRRAALAIGRVGLPEGVPPLVALLADPEPEVRQMAAFALGLLGDPSAVDVLRTALDDPFPMVQGRAAQALGRIGATDAAVAIGTLVQRHVTAAFDVDPEDLASPQSPEVEVFRLGVYALAELDAYEPLAEALIQDNGQPILWWWPVAYALQRLDDPRTLPALTTLAGVQGTIGVGFAAQGLGALGDPQAIPVLEALIDPTRRDPRVVGTAVRALAQIDDPRVGEILRFLVLTRGLDPALLLVGVEALGEIAHDQSTDVFIELLIHPSAQIRAAAIRGLARADPATFVRAVSTMEPDANWRVRAAVARAMTDVDSEGAVGRLSAMLADEDTRVIPSVLRALVHRDAPDIASVLVEQLGASDIVVRKTAAELLGEVKPDGAERALAAAYHAAEDEPSYLARAAALDALAELGGPVAGETLERALTDADWAVRVLAADRLRRLDPSLDVAEVIRPAPTRVDDAVGRLVRPSVSPHIYIETDRGTIQIELAVLEAPRTSANFMALARDGFYDGLTFHRVVHNYVVQAGDPRGDSEGGGPGYTIRDEINQIPFLRGTVGMALDWADTGGSQFFITHSPQPQLDGRYTAFGQVVSGIDVLDQLQAGDVIRRMRVWDGVTPLGG